MKTKLILIVISISISFIFYNCGNNTSSVTPPEDIKTTIGETIKVSGFPLSDIVPASIFDSVDAAFVTYQSLLPVRNGDNVVTQLRTSVNGYFTYPGEVEYLKFNGNNLNLDQIFYHPYYLPSPNWNYYNYTFDSPVSWEFKLHNSNTVNIPFNTCKNMHKIYISIGDSLSLSKPFTITWQPAGDNDFLVLNFTWKSMFADTAPSKNIVGLKNITDNGRLDFSANSLQNYGIPDYGILYFNLIRYKTISGKFDNNTKKYLLLNVIVSPVYLALKK